MQRDPAMYGRTESGWFLGSLTLAATTIVGGLPLDWWWRVLLGIGLAFALLPVLGGCPARSAACCSSCSSPSSRSHHTAGLAAG